MRHRPASPAQRTRRFLKQEALKRSHRRGELIRLLPEGQPMAFPPHPINDTASTDTPAMTDLPS